MTPARWACLVVLLAVVARLGLFLAASGVPEGFVHEPDSSEYWTLARNLVGAGRFSLQPGPPFAPDHTRTPGYPAVLATLAVLAGPAPVAAALVGALIGAGTVAVLVVGGARSLGPERAAVAGGILALDPASVAYSMALLTEPLFTLCLVLGLLAVWDGLRVGRLASLARGSAWLGLAALVRPIGLYLPLLLAGALASRRDRGWRWLAAGATVLLLGTGGLTLPWMLRNAWTGGRAELSAIPTINLYYHRAGAVLADAWGVSREAVRTELAGRLADMATAGPLSEPEVHRWMDRWAREIILADPLRYARLHLVGLLRMLGPDPEPTFQRLGWLTPERTPRPDRRALWTAALALEGTFLAGLYLAAGLGLARAIRERAAWLALPAALTIVYGLMVGGPETYARFRVPLMPALAWLAALGVSGVPASSWIPGPAPARATARSPLATSSTGAP
jgi:4-amino-4-deoxy-L-arabinose transferase-like glycosyltransferase